MYYVSHLSFSICSDVDAGEIATELLVFALGAESENLFLDSADTFALLHSDLGKALLAPAGSPGVLEDPVFLAIPFTFAVTNEETKVVCGSIALTSPRFENTSLVVLETEMVGVELDDEGLCAQPVLHLVDVVGSEVDVVINVDAGGLHGVVLALILLASVIIVSSKGHVMALHIPFLKNVDN